MVEYYQVLIKFCLSSQPVCEIKGSRTLCSAGIRCQLTQIVLSTIVQLQHCTINLQLLKLLRSTFANRDNFL